MDSHVYIKWIRLSVAIVIMMTIGILYAWSVFTQPLSVMFPTWTTEDISWIFSVTMVFVLIGQVISGRLTTRIKPSYVVRIGALLLIIGFFWRISDRWG